MSSSSSEKKPLLRGFFGREVESGGEVVVAVEVDPVVPPVVITAGMVTSSVSPLLTSRIYSTGSLSPPTSLVDECIGEIKKGFRFIGCRAAFAMAGICFFFAGIVK